MNYDFSIVSIPEDLASVIDYWKYNIVNTPLSSHLRWSNRGYPDFLRHIPFKVRIYKLMNGCRRLGIFRSIESKLGQVDETSIIEPTINKEAEDIPSVELEFRYTKLQNICITLHVNAAIQIIKKQGESSGTTEGMQIDSTSQSGTKRKAPDDTEEDTTCDPKRIELVEPQLDGDQGLVVLLKPPKEP
ncbi:hypothetical protein IGI04_029705 [Brassica rapa subsp. trilocularis]|uniref:DUF4283 domain-containing protein n=1 Tax=Brassica rapa subsp. trilocularis TaxID=1813537 RepID=A0ABQ7LNQ6_BRACM|nr:hypothetical protein IGI04_029705 [Brassica rapa subsp. trilocularis]